METNRPHEGRDRLLEEILGYLELSSGKHDARFQRNWNDLFSVIEQSASPQGDAAWRCASHLLRQRLNELRGVTPGFGDPQQASAVLELVFEHLLPAYRRHHSDLLFHQRDEDLFRPFFLARAFEAVLVQAPPWTDADRIVRDSLHRLNDFLGHRPIPVLRTRQRMEPYAHERVAPVPLYLRGAGVAVGRYHDLVQLAMTILESTTDTLLDEACFNIDLLDELAFDPRAYDFDHPANRRPNYHFGQWDPHRIDNSGRYRRFVVPQVTLDALLERVECSTELPGEELLWEGSAVLAGTILMATGMSGRGPETHDSYTSLATLIARIARYRDEFYERLLGTLANLHGARLRVESAERKQPLAGARQHLNQTLARRRARQMQHAHLAELYARMGYPEASLRQAAGVPVASSRFVCEIGCLITSAQLSVRRGQAAAAADLLAQIEELIGRGIECGALVDPWCMLGFGGKFAIFPAPENSVHDHRVDQLVRIMEQTFDLYARIQSEAAAARNDELVATLDDRLRRRARWWDAYATADVSDVPKVSGQDAFDAATSAAAALGAWHQAGAAAGDVAFWRRHVGSFQSARAYGLVVEALLDQRDYVAAMALSMQWLAESPEGLNETNRSFSALVRRWMREVQSLDNSRATTGPESRGERWTLTRRFFDYLEANAEAYWQVPRFEGANEGAGASHGESNGPPETDGDQESREPDELFDAAYEGVTYRDSTRDGIDANMLEAGPPPLGDYELDIEAERLCHRLEFLTTLASLWKMVAARSLLDAGKPSSKHDPQRDTDLQNWQCQATENARRLSELLRAVYAHQVPPPSSSTDSRIEYARRAWVKHYLAEQVIATAAASFDAALWLRAAVNVAPEPPRGRAWERPFVEVLRAVMAANVRAVRNHWPSLRGALVDEPLLYVPPAKGGRPAPTIAARILQQALRVLLAGLPRLGLLEETRDLLVTAQAMERRRTVPEGAVTEFDRLFRIGLTGMAESLVAAAEVDGPDGVPSDTSAVDRDDELIECLQSLIEGALECWLEHSRSLRLSTLERLADHDAWDDVKRFIERYGADLFTQPFLNHGNLRAILDRGIADFLEQWEHDRDNTEPIRLLDELDRGPPREKAVEILTLVLESVVDGYVEYRDYNTTTTQSDRGELLYTLLDFLRLKASYDRVAWNLVPAMIVHEVLVRRGKLAVAERWRRMLAEQTTRLADWHLKRLEALRQQYGMTLATVADHLEQRFVRPLALDHIRALVRPAMMEANGTGTAERAGHQTGLPSALALLEQEIAEFAESSTSAGDHVRAWLVALDEEVDQCRSDALAPQPLAQVPVVRISLEEARRQLGPWRALELPLD